MAEYMAEYMAKFIADVEWNCDHYGKGFRAAAASNNNSTLY
jgi:hypothetical protein